MIRRLFFAALVLGVAPVWSADDSVFDAPVDRAEPEPAAAPDAPGLRWSGHSDIELGLVVPPLSGGALATSTLAVDADPQPGLHLRTAFQAAVPGPAALTLTELWAQTSTSPAWLVRLGLQPLSWQTARVFSTVDLASHVGTDLSARAQAIVGPLTFDGVVSAPVPPADGPAWGQDSLASTATLASLNDVVGAGRVELSVPGGALALAARQSAFTEVNPGLRLTLGPVDVFGEGLLQHRWRSPGYQGAAVFGFFTEVRPVQLYGEWSWDERRAPATPQNQVALAGRWLGAVVPSGQVGVEWRHSLGDGTGRVLPGVSAELLPGLRTDLGVWFAYHTTGPSGLYFTEDTTVPAAVGTRLRVNVTY